MKTLYSIILFISIGYIGNAQNLQNINEENNNAVSFSIGYDYGMVCELDYYRKLNVDFTSWINFEFSSPLGDKNFDDFKTKFGIDIEAFKRGDLHIYTSLKTGYKRFGSEMVTYNAIGSNLGLTAGYYKTNWYIAGEFSYNNSATFLIEHSDTYKASYPDVKDGHYILTGTQLSYGINSGVTIRNWFELNLKAGLTSALGKDKNAMLPYYCQIGVIKAF